MLQSFENKREALPVGDPLVIKAGICYTVQEAEGICFSSGESAVGLLSSPLQEQQMFGFPILLNPKRKKTNGSVHD